MKQFVFSVEHRAWHRISPLPLDQCCPREVQQVTHKEKKKGKLISVVYFILTPNIPNITFEHVINIKVINELILLVFIETFEIAISQF